MIETSNILSKFFPSQGLPVSGNLGDSASAGGPRFDALLSEVSRTMSAATGKDDLKLNEKLSAALSAAMASLVQLPASQIRQLSADVKARSSWVEGLNVNSVKDLAPQERASLKQLVGIAISRISPPGTAVMQDPIPLPKQVQAPGMGRASSEPRAATENPGPQGWIPVKEEAGNESQSGRTLEVTAQARFNAPAAVADVVQTADVKRETGQAPLAPAGSAPGRVATLFSRPAETQVRMRADIESRKVDTVNPQVTAVRNGSSPVVISTRTGGFEPESGKAPSISVGQALKQESSVPRTEQSPQSRDAAPSQGAAKTEAVAGTVVAGTRSAQAVPGQVAAAPGTQVKNEVNRPLEAAVRKLEVSEPEVSVRPEGIQVKAGSAKPVQVAKPSPQAKAAGQTVRVEVPALAQDVPEDMPEMTVLENHSQPEAVAGTEIFEVKPGPTAKPALEVVPTSVPQGSEKAVFESITEIPQTPPEVQFGTPVTAPVLSQSPASAPALVSVPAPAAAVLAAAVPAGNEKSQVSATATASQAVTDGVNGEVEGKQVEFADLKTLPLGLHGDLQRLKDGVVREFVLRESVLKQVAAQVEGAGKEASLLHIRLKPESLGSLDITLKSEGGRVAARIFAENHEIRDVIANNLAAFKQTLEDQGLKVQELSVAVRAGVAQDFSQGRRQEMVWQAPAVPKEPVQDRPFLLTPDAAFGASWNSSPGHLSVLA